MSTIAHRNHTQKTIDTIRRTAWTGVLLQRIQNGALDRSLGRMRVPSARAPQTPPDHSGWARLFARPAAGPAKCDRPTLRGPASLPNASSVCGKETQSSRPSRRRGLEQAAKQGLRWRSSITFHDETDFCRRTAWFTLTDAQIRPRGVPGFATRSLIPQYGVGCADSQGGRQSFRS